MNIQSVAIKNLWIYKTEEMATIRAINMTHECAQIGYGDKYHAVRLADGKWTVEKSN
jgi:hypothetical protein